MAYIQGMPQSKLVVVWSSGNEGEAYVAKGVLESAGIDAMIQADTGDYLRIADDPEVFAMQTASRHTLCCASSRAPFANALA